MDSDDPDLEAFKKKSNLCRILRERGLGKAAALKSNLCPNSSDPQSIGISSKDNARRESPCCTSSQSDSEDLPEDHETSSEWKFEGHIYFEAGRWPAGKTYEDAVRAALEEQYLPTVPVPVHRMEIFYNSAAEPDRELLKLPIRGYVQAKSASRRKWRKWIEAAALEWEKIQGGIPLHEAYILDTQKNTDPRDTDRFLLSHGKLSGFRVCGTAWTFSGTVRVDQPWDDSLGKDLVEIARSKFKEAEGARERPDAIEYLSVHCDISLLILGSPSEAQKVPLRGFLQTANTTWKSLWERWLPDFAWRPVRGGLCGNLDFQKALAEIRLDKSPWIEMLVQGELGRNNAGRRAARASSSSSKSSRSRSSTSSSTRQVKTRVAACMQAEAPAYVVPYSAGGLRWRRVKIHWRSEAQSEYKADPLPLHDGSGAQHRLGSWSRRESALHDLGSIQQP